MTVSGIARKGIHTQMNGSEQRLPNRYPNVTRHA
jgi:hypothetical protein